MSEKTAIEQIIDHWQGTEIEFTRGQENIQKIRDRADKARAELAALRADKARADWREVHPNWRVYYNPFLSRGNWVLSERDEDLTPTGKEYRGDTWRDVVSAAMKQTAASPLGGEGDEYPECKLCRNTGHEWIDGPDEAHSGYDHTSFCGCPQGQDMKRRKNPTPGGKHG